MSSNLTVESVERKKLNLNTSLKFALCKRYGEPINTIISHHSMPFLEGLIAAGDKECADDAQKLIEYIMPIRLSPTHTHASVPLLTGDPAL